MAKQRQCSTCQQVYPASQLLCPVDSTPLDLLEEPGSAEADPLIGQTLDDRYLIKRVLGAGGMGTVYMAEHLISQKMYAIKALHPKYLSDQDALQRFEREARAIWGIDHPHIVEVYDYGRIPSGAPFLVMEYLEGTSLRTHMDETPGPGLSLQQAVSIAIQTAQALQYVHERGVVHRDVKPDNIQLTASNQHTVFAKLFDFGIARIEGQTAVTRITDGPPKTLGYAAPEMHKGGEYLSPSIDVYALGITLFEMITKQRPFNGNAFAVAWAHMSEPPPKLSQRRHDVKVPAALDELLLQMLAKVATHRPTMDQISQRLAMLTTQLPPEPKWSLHELRTYLLPQNKREHSDSESVSAPPSSEMPQPSPPQTLATMRAIDQIEAEREQFCERLEEESRAIIKRYFSQEPPSELAELLSRCASLEKTRSELELELALLQDSLEEEKAQMRTARNELRQRLHELRDEQRARSDGAMPWSREAAQELMRVELAYAAPEQSGAMAARVQQEEIHRQQLRADLLASQRQLALRLLDRILDMSRARKSTNGPKDDGNLGLLAKRLTSTLSQLDALNEALAKF